MNSEDENRRLAFLHSLDILDTPLEETYERITRLLCRVLNVPMAAVSLVDENRLWFKSIHGVALQEVPRTGSFCTETILKPGVMVVPDARLDNRFKHSSIVQEEPKIVYYAGYPIRITDRLNVGTLCIFDTKPRDFSSTDLQFLEDISGTVSSELKGRLLKDIYHSPSVREN